MKNVKYDKKNVLILIIIILLLILLVVLFTSITRKSEKSRDNGYNFSSEVVELPGTQVIENEKLSSEHCLDGICIYDAKIYYVGNEGRVDFKIKNTTGAERSGYIKMQFSNDSLITVYKNLQPGHTMKQTAQYGDLDLSGEEDFTVLKLNKKDKANLVTIK